MLVMLTGIVALGSVMVVAALPSAPAVAPSRRRPPRGGSSAYRSYDRVTRDLSWADVSPRHYDTTTRPMLQRLLAARLLTGHGINLSGDPEAARRLVGDDLWSYLDPARPVNASSQPPGIDPTTLARIIDRLEQL